MEALRRRLIQAHGAQGALAADWRDLRDAPWIMWEGEPRLASQSRLAEAVFAQASQHRRTLGNLIEAWIRGFEAGAAGILEGGQRIAVLLSTDHDLRFDLWRNAHVRVALFDADSGPRRLAEWVLIGPDLVVDVLRYTGIDDPLRGVGGYARAVQCALLRVLPSALVETSAELALSRACEFLTSEGKLRFQDLRGGMARGVLQAWREPRREPAEPVRKSAADFLLRHLGDPRLRPGNWIGAGEEAAALMRRWLTRASLDAFFDLISDHALDAHWKWRQGFWSACLEQCDQRGVPFDAWLVLGPRVFASARAVRDLGGAYARLDGTGVQPEHSVLLMRIGPLVLCEWSHNGKLRAWPNDWANAPKLYRSSYNRSDLTGEGLPFPPNPAYRSRGNAAGDGLSHFSSSDGYWQGSAAELLARRAGIRLTDKDWRPR